MNQLSAEETQPPSFTPSQCLTLSEFQEFVYAYNRVLEKRLQFEREAHSPGFAIHYFCFTCNQRRVIAGSTVDGICKGVEVCTECGLSERERAAIHLLMQEFCPPPLSTIRVIGDQKIAATIQKLSLATVSLDRLPSSEPDAKSKETDFLLVVDAPSSTSAEWQIDRLFAQLTPGGGMMLALDSAVSLDRCWQYMEQLCRFGFVDVSLLDAWSQTFGYVGKDLFFIKARRSATVAICHNTMTSRTNVSVVIPLYNHEKYIAAALESVFCQTCAPAEVIVIDDGSSDRSADIAARLCSQYRGAVFWQQPNRGAHNAINTGVHRATQPVIAILNSDDTYHPQRLERCLAAMNDSGDTIIASGIDFLNENSNQIENPWYEEAVLYWRNVANTSLALLNGNFLMTTSNLVLHRRVFEDIGYFQNFRYAHDLDFFVRALGGGHRLTVIPEKLLDYRFHSSNTISENHTKVRSEWAFICASVMRSCPDPLLEGMNRWEYMEKLNRVVQNHRLVPGILFILEAMLEHGSRDLDYTKLINYPEFRDRLYRSLG